jgi:hypothetical protein
MSGKELQMAAHSLFKIPLAPSPLSAGFGSEALDLNKLVCGGIMHAHLAYEVSGSSCEPHIMPGSIVIVNRYRHPNDGDTVAVLLNGNAFVKIFERRESGLRLVSPNEEYPAQEVHAYDDFECLGVVEWSFSPVVRQAAPQNPVHHFQEVSPASGRIKAVMADQNGNEVHLNLAREEVMRGIALATKALANKILTFSIDGRK